MNQFKVLHFADAHLGLALYGLQQRIFDHAKALDEVVRVAKEEDVDLVVDGGDTMDSPEPDPVSIKAYREFSEKLKALGIPLAAVVGNHNIHRISAKTEAGTWLDAVGGVKRCVSSPGDIRVIRFDPKPGRYSGNDGFSMVMADWMPADRLEEFLAGIERDYRIDMLLMHQSCEGFEPKIAHTELQLNQLRGCARVIALGDIHVAKTIDIEPGCRVTYPGSTELCSKSEAHQKSVNIITFTRGEPRAEIKVVPIRTRPVVTAEIRSETDLIVLESNVKDAGLLSGDAPLVVFTYDRSLDNEVRRLRERLAETTSLIKAVPQGSVEASVTAPDASGATTMEEILAEELSTHPDLQQIAISLWRNPKGAEQIIESLHANLKARLEPGTAPAPAPTT